MIKTYKNPTFTSITSLYAAATANSTQPTFTLVWPDAVNVVKYKIYRHIERKYPSNQATGGGLIDPTNPSMPLYTNPPIYKLIVDNLSPDDPLSYDDDLYSTMSIHQDEGIKLDSLGVWRDDNGTGADIIDEILHTDRRIFYKLVAVTRDISFNSTPFIYTCHPEGVECRSVITQVHWNTLYEEGEVAWFNTDITDRNRTSVDLIFDVGSNRHHNVWVSGDDRVISVLKGSNGELVETFTIPSTLVNYVPGLRVDPDTGNGIIIGDNDQLYTCNIQTGAITTTVKTNTSFLPNGNTGLVLTNETPDKYAYIVANSDTVSKCDYSGNISLATSVVPRTELGCTSATPLPTNDYLLQNVLGVTNGPDQSVWVNNHVPIHYYYTETISTTTYSQSWASFCPGGNPIQSLIDYFNDTGQGTPRCERSEPRHYVTRARTTETTITVDNNFLQDIGYITGVGVNNSGIRNYPSSLTSDDASTYNPYTTSANREGWLGKSNQDTEGRPFSLQAEPSPDPIDMPLPGISQKGLTTDIPTGGASTPYNIFQVNQSEDTVHRLVWNSTTQTLTYDTSYTTVPTTNDDFWDINDPVHAIADSQNNIWVIQEHSTEQLTKIYYATVNDTSFPYGGVAVWPSITTYDDYTTSSYVYGKNYNDVDIEYALTRNNFTNLLTGRPSDGFRSSRGIILSGVNEGEQRAEARSWLIANYLQAGRLIYPYYVAANGTKTFSRVGGTAATPSEYNSDNTGISFMFTTSGSESFVYGHPAFTYPTVDLRITPVASTPVNCDENFWGAQNIANSLNTAVSGYDDFTVQLSATLLDIGSFYFYGYNWHVDDKIRDLGTSSDNPIIVPTFENVYNYTYHDPSLNGKPFSRTAGGVAEPNGVFNPFAVVATNTDAYILSGDTLVNNGSSELVDATVWERWPTARFYVTPIDTPNLRSSTQALSTWNLSDPNFAVSDNNEALNSDLRIVSGYDPLSADFTDTSITRTWPISDWYWTFGDNENYLGFPLTNDIFEGEVTYAHVTTALIHDSVPASTRDDCTTEHPAMTAHLYKGPGVYYSTLYVRASNTNTTSWNISAGITDKQTMVDNFVSAATRQINVLEVCPAITFDLSGTARTVLSTYQDDKNPLSDYYNSGVSGVGTANSPYGIISGYAPYLDVFFTGILTSRSLPISAAQWDFGDAYTNHIDADEITLYDAPAVGWPVWNGGEPYITSGHHVYVMPGFYNVTLRSISSGDQIGYVSNCTGFEKPMHVYLEELPIIAGLSANILSGDSPITVDLSLSPYTSAGSFPVCRVDWDFGDNSPILTISRYSSSVYVNYPNNYAYEVSDPRNVMMRHEYNRTLTSQLSTYTASVSVYACNTNTATITSLSIGPIALESLSYNEGDIHLVENRMSHQNDDLLLVFEGENSLNTYTVLLSSAST